MDLDNSKLWHGILEKHLSDVISRKLDMNSRHLLRDDPLKMERSLTADFCCKDCGRKWDSRKVAVIFLYKLEFHRRRGQIEIQGWGQRCKTCSSHVDKFTAPKIHYESADRAVTKLKQKILEKFYGEQVPETTGIRHEFKERKKPHDMDNCEACLNGFCMANEKRREMDEMAGYTDDMADYTDDMADYTDDMADYTDDMADYTDDMADYTDDMADYTDDMADYTDDMADYTGYVGEMDGYTGYKEKPPQRIFTTASTYGPKIAQWKIKLNGTELNVIENDEEDKIAEKEEVSSNDQPIYSGTLLNVIEIAEEDEVAVKEEVSSNEKPIYFDYVSSHKNHCSRSQVTSTSKVSSIPWPNRLVPSVPPLLQDIPGQRCLGLPQKRGDTLDWPETTGIETNSPISSYPPELLVKLRSLQTSVITIKNEMRQYGDGKESQWASVTNQINEILNPLDELAENSALDLPATRQPLESVSVNGCNNEAVRSISFKRKAPTDFENYASQKPTKMSKMSEASQSENFMVNSEGFVEVYTDGVCQDNGKDFARAGVGVWWGHNHKLNVSRPVKGSKQTNNVAAIQAATVTIDMAVENGIKKLLINTDSQFVINSATQWMSNWKRNGWMTKSRQPVKNREDLEDLDKAINCGSIQVKWNYVKGHGGQEGNEEAEKLAMKGAYL